mgnify:FL=1
MDNSFYINKYKKYKLLYKLQGGKLSKDELNSINMFLEEVSLQITKLESKSITYCKHNISQLFAKKFCVKLTLQLKNLSYYYVNVSPENFKKDYNNTYNRLSDYIKTNEYLDNSTITNFLDIND